MFQQNLKIPCDLGVDEAAKILNQSLEVNCIRLEVN